MSGALYTDVPVASLDEMQQISEPVLSFVRQFEDQEPLQSVDLASPVSSLCENLLELGLPAPCDAETSFAESD